MQPLHIRAIFLRSFRVGASALPLLLALGIVAYSPAIYRVIEYSSATDIPKPSTAFQLLTIVLSQVLAGTVAFVTARSLRNQPFSWWRTFHLGITRMAPIVMVGLVSSFSLIAMIGHPALFLPGIYAAILLSMAIPIAAVEQTSVFDSLRQSVERTQGYRLKIFGIFLIEAAFVVGGVKLLGFLFQESEGSSSAVFLASALAFQIVMAVGSAIVSAVIYVDLSPAQLRPTRL